MERIKRKPEWLRTPVRGGKNLTTVKRVLKELHLHTVCTAANCPNRMECFSNRTATFMILGDVCTRNCRFCNVSTGRPLEVEEDEPERIARAVVSLGLKHVVITSVTRDDLPDGGAAHFAATVRAVRRAVQAVRPSVNSVKAPDENNAPGAFRASGAPGAVRSVQGDEAVQAAQASQRDDARPENFTHPGITIELLIPDLQGDIGALRTVLDSKPDILNHNVETIPRLYPEVRPQADYRQSLEVLRRTKELDPSRYTKSGLMVGLGEKPEEIEKVMDDLREVGCDFLTIGQYLAPSASHYPVAEYVHPDQFEEYRRIGYRKGFSFVASAPLVRSSYRAAEMMDREKS